MICNMTIIEGADKIPKDEEKKIGTSFEVNIPGCVHVKDRIQHAKVLYTVEMLNQHDGKCEGEVTFCRRVG